MWLIPAVWYSSLCPCLWPRHDGRALPSQLWWRDLDHGPLWELRKRRPSSALLCHAPGSWNDFFPPKHWVQQWLKTLLLSWCCRLGSHQIERDSAAPTAPSPMGTWVLPPCKCVLHPPPPPHQPPTALSVDAVAWRPPCDGRLGGKWWLNNLNWLLKAAIVIVMWQAVTAQTATHSECDSWQKG